MRPRDSRMNSKEYGNLEYNSMSWDILPHIVLCNIFKYLDREKDRYNASLVSKAWLLAFRSPELWREMNFRFGGFPPPPLFSEKAFKFAVSLGECLHELNINCTLHLNYRTNSESIHNFLLFLLILNRKPISLKKFSLSGINFNSAWKDDWKRNKITNEISKFLDKQKRLTSFDMRCCDAPLEMGIDFLRQLAINNSHSLRNINLKDFFISRCDVLSSPHYLELMGSFTSLVKLCLDYSYLDENVLTLVVSKCKHSLKELIICCGERGPVSHVIPKCTWTWVRKICPQLQVDFNVVLNDSFSDCTHLIPREAGLYRFILRKLLDYEIDLNPTLIYLFQFQETLVDMYLEFNFNRNFDEGLLLELVSSCRKLNYFTFDGIANSQTVKSLCDMQRTGIIHLKGCNITVQEGDEQTKAAIEELHELNRSYFENQGGFLDLSCLSTSEDEDYEMSDSLLSFIRTFML